MLKKIFENVFNVVSKIIVNRTIQIIRAKTCLRFRGVFLSLNSPKGCKTFLYVKMFLSEESYSISIKII